MIPDDERILWDAVLLVIKGADGRYGLKLYGHLEGTLNGLTLSWISETLRYQFSITIDHRRAFDDGVISLITNEAEQRIRTIVEHRDRASRK